jgi:hypothetical protein
MKPTAGADRTATSHSCLGKQTTNEKLLAIGQNPAIHLCFSANFSVSGLT